MTNQMLFANIEIYYLSLMQVWDFDIKRNSR